ncbi:MAG: clostripain-related cysteine peptidase [Clostridiales bacterium]
MKKSIKSLLSSLIILCLLFSSTLSILVYAQPLTTPYTFFVYLNGSDLESAPDAEAATSDIKEMMQIGSTENVNIILETGGTSEWKTNKISNTENQRWKVEKNDITLIKDGIGNKSMGSPDTLKDFVIWGMENYPAEKYALIYWNHGAGAVNGYGYDEINEDTSLTLDEIKTAMSECYNETGNQFEVVGFDACLMATLETAFTFKDYANYFVASEELEPGHGWNYTPIIDSINKNPQIEGADLGKVIADGFKFQAEDSFTSDAITLSVTDLSKISNVITNLDNYISKLQDDIEIPEKFNYTAKARSKSEDYGSSPQDGSTDMVDLANLAENTLENYPEVSQQLINSINEAVVYNIKSPGKPNANGLSIYFPYKDKENFSNNLSIYKNIDFSNTYKNYINEYSQKILGDSTPIEFEDNTPNLTTTTNNQETDPDTSEQDPNYDETDQEYSDNEDYGSLLEVKIDKDELGQIAEVYSILGAYSDESKDEVIFLSMDNDVFIDYETGLIKDNFTGYSVTLNGNFISMYLEDYDEEESFYEYSIPVKLNNVEVDLITIYSEKYPDGHIIGAWEGIDESTNVPDKDLIKISNGDKIIPQYYYENEETEDYGYLDGKEFTVKDELKLDYLPLPAGEYLYGFQITDIAQNDSYSDFIDITLDDFDEENKKDNILIETENGYEYIDQNTNNSSEDPNEIKVKINGTKLNFEVNPIIKENRTLVPLRAIFEALGMAVYWDNDTKTVTGINDDIEISLQIGNKTAIVNGEKVFLDSPAIVKEGRTLVPVRFIAESTGAKVSWDSNTKTVIITMN